MKLINFYKSDRLNALLKQMGAELKKMESDNSWEAIDDSKLAELLKTGEVEIDVDEIETVDGVFQYKGQKVIVYIRDQYSKYHAKGYKFHLSKCSTISKAFQYKRNSRYVISLRTDGQFKINLIDDNVIVEKDLIERLQVCKNCLDHINYKAYRGNIYETKINIYNNFELLEYFNSFESSQLDANQYRNAYNAPLNVYNQSFNETSRLIKHKNDYVCSECNIDLSKQEHNKFAHTHHVNGDKSNDSESNLEVLCIACHADKPGHERLRYSPDFLEFKKLKSNYAFNI